MALIVEDGTGKVDAESYISVADADTYLAEHADDASWTPLATAAKEKALRIATQYLELAYSARYRGVRKTATQALGWPRQWAYDDDEYQIDDASVPSTVARASAEAALRHVVEGDLLPDIAEERAIVSEAVKVGPIEQELHYSGTKPTLKKFTKIELLMRAVTERGNVLIRS